MVAGRDVCHHTQCRRVNEGTVMLDRIDHVGIACHDLTDKIAFYESVFDLTVMSREVNKEQGVREAMLRIAAAPGGSSWIQLLEPLAPDTPVGRFLARRQRRAGMDQPPRSVWPAAAPRSAPFLGRTRRRWSATSPMK